MTSNPIDDIVFFGLALNEGAKRAEHRLQTAKCPTIPEFEHLAKLPVANWSVIQFLHTKGCPYCQLSLKLLKRQLGIKPWWEQWGERAQQVIDYLTKMPGTAHAEEVKKLGTSLPALCTVPAVAIYPNQERRDSAVEILIAEITPDACLRLRLRMKRIAGKKEGLFSAAQMPVELTLIAHPTAIPVGAILLPHLTDVGEESCKMQIPREWSQTLPEWFGERATGEQFPLRFILRPGAGAGEV